MRMFIPAMLLAVASSAVHAQTPANPSPAKQAISNVGLPQGAVARIGSPPVKNADGDSAGVWCLSLAPQGRFVAVTHSEATDYAGWLRVWRVADGDVVRDMKVKHCFEPHAFAPDGGFAFVANARLFLARSPADKEPREFPKPEWAHQAYNLGFSPDGGTLYLTSPPGLQRWDVAALKRLPITGAFKDWASAPSYTAT